MERTASWFRDALGWECGLLGDAGNFGIARRDGARIMFALSEKRFVPNWKIAPSIWNVYIRVDDVDAMHDEIVGRGVELDYGLGDQPWGMREFGVQDPDGHDIAFGQPILRWEPHAGRVRVVSDGIVVAESVNAKLLYEHAHEPVVYIPDEDVRRDLLQPSDHHTRCPRTGEAGYWSLPGKPNAAWYYPDPIEPAAFIRGHVAFYANLVAIEVEE